MSLGAAASENSNESAVFGVTFATMVPADSLTSATASAVVSIEPSSVTGGLPSGCAFHVNFESAVTVS